MLSARCEYVSDVYIGRGTCLRCGWQYVVVDALDDTKFNSCTLFVLMSGVSFWEVVH